jgi:ABC-type cobalamin transport system ATPase subunit
MRILGTIPHPHCRIQIFQYGNRFSLKIEAGLYEQIFKFRESQLIQSIDDVIRLADTDFDTMHRFSGEAWSRFAVGAVVEEVWEEII